jgi:hypothetical protein
VTDRAAWPQGIWADAGLAFLLALLTLPDIDPSYGIGVDHSLTWAFNHLFANDREGLIRIAFPHGPLAFLMYPLAMGYNLWLGFAATIAVQFILMSTLLRLARSAKVCSKWRAALVCLVVGWLTNFNSALVFAVIGGLMVARWSGQLAWAVIAGLLAALALNVRAGTGIMSIAAIASFSLLSLTIDKAWKRAFAGFAALVVGAVVIRLAVFGHLHGTWYYFVALKELAGASSAATAYYPANNWYLLGPAIFLLISFPIWVNDKNVRWTATLLAPVIFAAWKHGMTRQDIMHYRGLFYFLCCAFLIFLLIWQRPVRLQLAAAATALILFFLNADVTQGWTDGAIPLYRHSGLVPWTDGAAARIEACDTQSELAIAQQKLPQEVLARLKGKSVDVYPWEFTYIPANKLNWTPRPVLQSYAAYTPWLDSVNAAHFSTTEASDVILLHGVDDALGGDLGSLDYRYLFNDEPTALLAMLRHYRWSRVGEHILLEQAETELLGSSTVFASDTGSWGQWIPVPEAAGAIVRARLHWQGTLFRAVKDLVYKDEVYTVHYLFTDGSVRNYRMVPTLATSGIWVNPFMSRIDGSGPHQVKAIMFTCTDKRAVQPLVRVEWEKTPYLSGQEKALSLFGEKDENEGQIFLKTQFSHEDTVSGWQWNTADVAQNGVFGSEHCGTVGPKGYSATFVMEVDSIDADVTCEFSAFARSASDAAVVISVEYPTGPPYWQAQSFAVSGASWEYASISRTLRLRPGAVFKCYVLNNGDNRIHVDGMSLKINIMKD